MNIFRIIVSFVFLITYNSCTSTKIAKQIDLNNPLVLLKYNQIKNENPTLNYFIGRRYYIPKTQFWGYLRKPGEYWHKSKLVIMNEKFILQPDRIKGPARKSIDNYTLAENTSKIHGFDHNYEYIIHGNFTGEKVYEPNINLFIDEFIPTKFQKINNNGGFLVHPDERYSTKKLPLKKNS